MLVFPINNHIKTTSQNPLSAFWCFKHSDGSNWNCGTPFINYLHPIVKVHLTEGTAGRYQLSIVRNQELQTRKSVKV